MISKEHYTIDFYLSLVVLSLASYNLPRFIYFIINKKNNFLSKILYYDISDKLIDVLTLITIIAFISYIFLNRYLPFFKKILKTPMKYYYSLHGVTYGIILGLLTWIIINFCVFQMVWFFEGDFIIIGILIGVLLFSIQKIYYSIIQNKIIKNENPDIFQEIPILTKNDDKLEHSKVVDEIKSILFDPDDEYGKTIALYGRNGSGKTSVINLLKESLLGKKILFLSILNHSNIKINLKFLKVFTSQSSH